MGAFDDTGEFLGGENLEWFGEDRGEDGGGSVVDYGCAVGCFGGLGAHVDEAHFQTAFVSDCLSVFWEGTYRKVPSVRTLRSCRMNQTPILFSGSVRRNALALRLPIRLRVNIPPGPPETAGCVAAGDMEGGTWPPA